MAFKGDPLHKQVLQKILASVGYKLVRLKAYEERLSREQPREAGFNKLFCIGFNKTATTTLEQVLRDCGFRLPKQLEQEKLLAPLSEAKGYDTLKAFVEDYDAFQDLPFSQAETYVACDALFPGSKFILTIRDSQAWVESYIRYYKREFGLEGDTAFSEASFLDKTQYLEKNYVHKLMRRLLVEEQAGQPVVRWDLAFDPDFLMARYQHRNASIRSYFAGRPDDLLELDPSREKDTGRLLTFLGVSDRIPAPYPRTNKS